MKFVAGLTCHLCGATYPAEALWVCSECLGPLEVSYDCDIRAVFSTLAQAGARVRGSDRNVLSETRIDGITAFGSSTMTIRTSTRVRAGCHEGIAAALRLAIKEEFDHLAAVNSPGSPRNSLVPEPVRAAVR